MSGTSLFRQEVIDAKRSEWLGSIIVAAPLSRWLLVSWGLALAALILIFLVFGQYTRRESVVGQLVPDAGLLNVTANNAGTIVQVLVRDGQKVHRGDPLIEISSEQGSAALGDTHALVSDQLDEQQARLKSDLLTQQQISKQQVDALSGKVALLRSQITQIDEQLVIQKQLTASAQNLLERIKPLAAKNFVSAFQIQQQETALLDARAQHKTLMRQQLELRQQANTAAQQLAQLPLDAATQRNDTERKLADIRQAVAQNEMRRAVVLRAPRDGTISTVLLKQGQMVAAGQSLLSLLPSGAVLQAQLLVPSRAVGFIEPGSRVVLRYQAFPYQKFGQHYGYVSEISRSTLTTSEVTALIGADSRRTQEPLYRVQVALDNQYVLAYGRSEALRTGMALDADVLMERRRLIEWVFEPLYGLSRRLVMDAAHG
ncbi:HlyD family secretion protein [Dyella tabacisoli]|uniref:HlyD family efflux transporter periplasmic adaptor subunit n=1 Tax=Dyella tabacisoli TaxID=2282381 RepID=A0A369UJW6_9GAMM|nr:HlyD family efflux transporter periplasmic adaptor subunit [Dyella tabacisoli]RDD80633.1 HlyD family efflux transporter periplasmic adaptor subunit [Dyella tabacisoli]